MPLWGGGGGKNLVYAAGNMQGSGSLEANSFGVTSAKQTTGTYLFTFVTPLSSANSYVVIANAVTSSGDVFCTATRVSGSQFFIRTMQPPYLVDMRLGFVVVQLAP